MVQHPAHGKRHGPVAQEIIPFAKPGKDKLTPRLQGIPLLPFQDEVDPPKTQVKNQGGKGKLPEIRKNENPADILSRGKVHPRFFSFLMKTAGHHLLPRGPGRYTSQPLAIIT